MPVNHAMPAVVNGKLYLIGGQTDAGAAYINVVQVYDPTTQQWQRRANMPTSRSAGAAAVIDGKIFVAGGRPPRGADFAVYDPEKDEWTTLPNLPTQRNHLAAVAVNGKMYVIGGRFDGGFQSVQADAVEIYDPASGAWTKGAPMLKPRGGLNAVAAYGCIHVFGGEHAIGVHPDHDLDNPVTDTWEQLSPMPTPVHGVTGLTFIDGLIYLPGGGVMQGGSSGSRLHQVYRPNQVCR
jgi:N-acetylneuraminic acid mutarotase